MASVRATPLAPDSALHAHVAPGDFLDCYAIRAPHGARRAAEIVVEFPDWVRALMKLRGVLTAPFGLLNDGPPSRDKIGPFPVVLETGDELVAGFDDRHLDFRISIMARRGEVSMATWVHTHNLGGRCYLRAILPFHVVIVRNALERVAAAPVVPGDGTGGTRTKEGPR